MESPFTSDATFRRASSSPIGLAPVVVLSSMSSKRFSPSARRTKRRRSASVTTKMVAAPASRSAAAACSTSGRFATGISWRGAIVFGAAAWGKRSSRRITPCAVFTIDERAARPPAFVQGASFQERAFHVHLASATSPVAIRLCVRCRTPRTGPESRSKGELWELDRDARMNGMPTSVVSGGAGFLGSHLCDYLLAKGHRVICIDNLDTGSLQNIEHVNNGEDFLFVNHD